MSKSVFTLVVNTPPERTFAFLADLTNTVGWDPPVKRAEALDPDVRVGTRFVIWLSFAGVRIKTSFRLTEVVEPRKLALSGSNRLAEISDQIIVEDLGGGRSRIWTESTIRLRGVFRALEPALKVMGGLIASGAVRGLRKALDSPERPAVGTDEAGV